LHEKGDGVLRFQIVEAGRRVGDPLDWLRAKVRVQVAGSLRLHRVLRVRLLEHGKGGCAKRE
jgi:hypothetical protein